MTIVIYILKCIGLLLLIFLGLLLLVLAGIVFVPVRYRISGELTEEVHLQIRMNWLLHFIRFQAIFKKSELQKQLFILGIPIKGKEEKSKKKVKSKRNRKVKEKRYLSTEEKLSYEKKSSSTEEERSHEKRSSSIEEELSHEKRSSSTEEALSHEDTTTFVKNEKKSVSKEKPLIHLMKKGKDKWKDFKEKLSDIQEVITRIKTEIQNEHNRNALSILFQELNYLLRHISPRKAKGAITFGMKEPSSTGQFLGLLSMIPFIYRYNINIQPDFETEQSYIRGSFEIKGHIRGIHILASVYRSLKDKHIQNIIQRYRNS